MQTLQESECRLEARVSERTRDLEEVNARLVDSERTLEHLAHHDGLTRLANRRRLEKTFAQAAARSRRTRRPLALLLVDLDGFRDLRERRGRAFGDRVVVTLADRLHNAFRDADHAARLGGDEFAVLAENLASTEEAGRVAAKRKGPGGWCLAGADSGTAWEDWQRPRGHAGYAATLQSAEND